MKLSKLISQNRRPLIAVGVAVLAAAITTGGIELWDRMHSPASNDVNSPTTLQDETAALHNEANFGVEDNLDQYGWLRAFITMYNSKLGEPQLSFAITPGMEESELSEAEWERLGQPLHSTDTIRPKRNCVIHIRTHFDGHTASQDCYSFNFCAFVDSAIRTRNDKSAVDLRKMLWQLFNSYSKERPLVYNVYDFGEFISKIHTDEGNFDVLCNMLSSEEETYQIDSISTYSDASPTAEALLTTYPPISYINITGVFNKVAE